MACRGEGSPQPAEAGRAQAQALTELSSPPPTCCLILPRGPPPRGKVKKLLPKSVSPSLQTGSVKVLLKALRDLVMEGPPARPPTVRSWEQSAWGYSGRQDSLYSGQG